MANVQNILSQDLDVIPQGVGTVILRLKPTVKEVLNFITPAQLNSALASLKRQATITNFISTTPGPPGPPGASEEIEIAATRTSTLTANALFTDAKGAETVAVLNGVAVTATGTFQGSVVIENIGVANINYSVTLGGSGATWNLYILAERLF